MGNSSDVRSVVRRYLGSCRLSPCPRRPLGKVSTPACTGEQCPLHLGCCLRGSMPQPPLQGGGSGVTEEARLLGPSHSQETHVLVEVRGGRGP